LLCEAAKSCSESELEKETMQHETRMVHGNIAMQAFARH